MADRERRAERARQRAAARERAFGDLCEASDGRAVVWRREGWSPAEILRVVECDGWALDCFLRWTRREATRRIDRLRHAERRPLYYAQEKARRQAMAAERRKVVRRTTDNPCPTPAQLLDAWEAAQESHEGVLRFGSLLEDLACYVDSSLVRTEEGAIRGRRGGIKEWLGEHLPALYLKYKTVMAYKAAARKAKQLTGLADPTPAARLVDAPSVDDPLELVRARAVYCEIIGEPVADEPRRRTGAASGGAAEVQRNRAGAATDEQRRCNGKVADGLRAPRSRTAWLARIEAFANPERVTEATTLAAWKRKYENEITVRTKSMWVERARWRWWKSG